MVPAERLDAEVDELHGAARPARPGDRERQAQRSDAEIDQPLDTAYAVAADAMVRDLSAPDAAEGIDAFLEKRTARWPSTRTED